MAKQTIISVAREIFVQLSQKRLEGQLSSKEFRAEVCNQIVQTFPVVTIESARTHYNNVKAQYELENNPIVAGLGRVMDKRGGRTPGRKNSTFALRNEVGEIVAHRLTRADAESLALEVFANNPQAILSVVSHRVDK